MLKINNSLFVTGDKHGDIQPIIDFIKKFNLGQDDSILVLGDMGLFWLKDQRDAKLNIDNYEQNCNGVHLYWIDGNHENFDLINKFEKNKDSYCDNSEHIHYLPRGTVFYIRDKKALALGGADSVDKFRRTEGISWWADEKITEDNIKQVKEEQYDYIFSHAAPQSIVKEYRWKLSMLLIMEDLIDHDSEIRLDELMNKVKFNNWWFGHYHSDTKLNDKFICLYHDFIEI